MDRVLVTGATGHQGSAVVKQLISDGFQVSVFVRSADAADLKNKNISISKGDFEDLESLVSAFQKVDKVALSFPLVFDKGTLIQFSRNVVEAWKQSNVSLIVFNTNLPVLEKEIGFAAFDIKLAIEQLFDAEKLPYISLRPTLYMDNFSAPFLLPVIRQNSILPYPVPADKRIAWISHKDLAKFVSAALKRDDLKGHKFNIGGVQQISGNEMAESISKLAQKEIQFVSMTPDEFEQQLGGSFGEVAAKEISNIYRFVKADTEYLQAGDLRERTLVYLPVGLDTFDNWASEVEWS